MTAPAQTLEIIEVAAAPEIIPTHNMILATSAFVSTLKEVEATVASLKIVDAASAQLAADTLTRLTKAGTALDKQRKDLVRPFQDMIDRINAAAKSPAGRIDTAKATLKQAQTTWLIAQENARRAEEQRRAKELRDLELKRQQEERDRLAKEAEAQRKADAAIEAAKASGARVVIDDEDLPAVEPPAPTAVEQRIAAIQSAPVVAAAKPSGVRVVVTLVPFVEDVNKLPDVFLKKEANLPAIRAAFCTGYSEDKPLPFLAGVRFEVQRTTQSTGRSAF